MFLFLVAMLFSFQSLAQTVDFEASGSTFSCSGALIRLETSVGTDRAMILTNGHCMRGKMIKPGEVRANKKSYRSFKILEHGGKALAYLHSDLIIYGTMTGTDMAIYRLVHTYDALAKRYGLHGLVLSSRRPQEGSEISIISGKWRHIYKCKIDGFAHELHEDDYVMRDSIRYSDEGCDTQGGDSGAPVIDVATGKVVGIHNTKNEKGKKCTLNNPCEVDDKGNIWIIKGRSYGQQTYLLYSCLDSKNQLDLEKPGCLLPKVPKEL